MDVREEYFRVEIGNSSLTISSEETSPSLPITKEGTVLSLQLCYYESAGMLNRS